MARTANRVERGTYFDSVALMRVSRRVAALAGVEQAALMIGSPSNKELLREAGLLAPEGEAAGPNDLVVAVRGADPQAAIAAALGLLAERPGGADGLPRARGLAGAAALLPGANLALISVPGEFAAREARRALERGLHALVFSDNVALEDEIALKRLARDRGLLLMGPDCGTALIGGTPLAFANAVPRGAIGLVSASGTGLQEVSCLLARAGAGVSHGLGVGGRDLDARVGAAATLAALEALGRDPATRTLVLISKPPAPEVAARVLERVGAIGKPAVVCFLGLAEAKLPPNARLARTLRAAAEAALGRPLGGEPLPALPKRKGRVRGLYCGGTLCAEAQIVFLQRGLAVASNAPVPGATEGAPHELLDLGDDEYTRGRPHPMLEPDIRNDHVRAALAASDTAALLVDLVIGYGAHADPAGVLAGAVRGARVPVIASVTGTERDPQGYSRQCAILREAGVAVAASNAHAAEAAAALVSR